MIKELEAEMLSLVNELEADPLVSIKSLAENLGLPKAVVVENLDYLDKQDIAHVLAITSLAAIDQYLCYVYLSVEERHLNSVIAALSKCKYTNLVSSIDCEESHKENGKENLLATIRVGEQNSLVTITDQLHLIPGVRGIRIEPTIKFFSARYSRMTFSRETKGTSIEDISNDLAEGLKCRELDDLDIALIAELRKDGRASLRNIGRKYEVSDGTIRYRLNKLKTKKLVNIVTSVNPLAMGLASWAQLEIRYNSRHLDAIIRTLQDQSWYTTLSLTTGKYSLKCSVLAKDQKALLEEIVPKVNRLNGVEAVNCYRIENVYKLDTRWAAA